MEIHRATSIAVGATLVLFCAQASAESSPRLAFDVSVGGPASSYGASLLMQSRHGSDELLLSVGGAGDTTTNAEYGAYSSTAVGSIMTILARYRYVSKSISKGLYGGLAVEVGLGVSDANLVASGSSDLGKRTAYSRGKWVPLLLAGAGYGLRTDAGFRLTALVGWAQYTGDMSNADGTSGGNFTEDRAQVILQLDDASEAIVESGPYLELAIGWAF